MIKLLKNLFNNRNNTLSEVADRQYVANRNAFNSLRDYDAGKKEISTTNIEKLIRDLQQKSSK